MPMTLRAARVNKLLSQAEAAKLLGISEQKLRGFESGKKFPDVPMVKRIEEVYGVPYNDLIFLPEDTV